MIIKRTHKDEDLHACMGTDPPPHLSPTAPQSASNATSRPPSEKKPGELVILSGPLSVLFLRSLSVFLPRTSVYSVLICVQAVLRKRQNSQTWKSVNSCTGNFLPQKNYHKSPEMNVKCLNLAPAHARFSRTAGNCSFVPSLLGQDCCGRILGLQESRYSTNLANFLNFI